MRAETAENDLVAAEAETRDALPQWQARAVASVCSYDRKWRISSTAFTYAPRHSLAGAAAKGGGPAEDTQQSAPGQRQQGARARGGAAKEGC